MTIRSLFAAVAGIGLAGFGAPRMEPSPPGSPSVKPNRNTRSGAAAIKRAARKRRNVRARSSKRSAQK